MQYVKGLQATDPATGCKVLSLLESSKRYLWHGNVATARSVLTIALCTVITLNLTMQT